MRLLRLTLVLVFCGGATISTTACENERRAWSVIFVDENCVKRRFTTIEGEGVRVSTYEADGGLTPTARFDTLDQAEAAYPSATMATNCPDSVAVTKADLHRPLPALTPDGGSDIAK